MSIGYLSQNGMNKVFEQWATADPNLEQYGFGQLYDQNGEPKTRQKYKGMWVNPTDTTFNEYTLERGYQIIIYDVVFENESNKGDNENLIISDCEEIAFRLVRFLRSKSDIFDVTIPPIITPFSDRWLDAVSGVIIDVTIEFNAESSNCEDPSYTFNIQQNDLN